MSKEQEKRLSDLASSSIVGGDIAAVLAEVQELRALETKAAAPVWTACADSLPDSDTTVMTYAPDSAEPVWPGYHDGEEWVDMLGAPITDAVVTHWMHFPEPPSSLARALAEVEA